MIVFLTSSNSGDIANYGRFTFHHLSTFLGITIWDKPQLMGRPREIQSRLIATGWSVKYLVREHSYGNPSLFPLEITYKCIPPKDDLGGFWRNPGGPDNGVEIFGDTNVFPFSVSMFVYWRLSGEYLAVKKHRGLLTFPISMANSRVWKS